MCKNDNFRFAAYLVFSFAMHNYKVKLAWEEYQKEMELEKSKQKALRDAIIDESWTSDLENTIRSDLKGKVSLKEEISKRISLVDETAVQQKNTKPSANNVPSQNNNMTSNEVGIALRKNEPDSGRVI
jgi:hypothetical protein